MTPMEPNDQLRDSAVIAPVFRGPDGRLMLVIVRRTDYGIHGGQLAFPGGKHDAQDATMLETALRETHEEVFLGGDDVEVLADLPVIETSSTGYRIYPFLGKVRPPQQWRYDAREVAEVIEVAVEDLALPEAYGESMEKFPHLPEPKLISFYNVGPHRLWGATYRIVTALIPRLLAGEWDI